MKKFEKIKTSAITKACIGLKKFTYLICMTGIGLLFNSCFPGYVATEPTYVENTRPARPSELHIWVDGDWVYSRQNHNYVKKDGHWQNPAPGRTFTQGKWQTTPKGHQWKQGHWQRNK
jgi:hypothetical protein